MLKKTKKLMRSKTALRKGIYKRLSKREGKKVWEDACERLDTILIRYGGQKEHDDERLPLAPIYLSMNRTSPELAYGLMKDRLDDMPDDRGELPKGVRQHTDNYIFPAAAIYLALKEAAPDQAFDIMSEIMMIRALKAGKALARMTRLPGFRRFFLKMWDRISRRTFGERSGFRNVYYPKEKGRVRMDITECPYNKYLTELGCPELTQLFCRNDEYMYGSLPGLRFTRGQTLGTGGEKCDFCIETQKRGSTK